MAEEVAKLYASIGFKVKSDDLTKVQNLLKDLTNRMNAINNATKKAASQYGIFSKERSKQELANAKLATENERAANQRSKRLLETKKFEQKQLMDFARLALQVEKANAREQNAIDAQKTRDAKKQLQQRLNDQKIALGSVKQIWTGLKSLYKTMLWSGGAAWTAGQNLLSYTAPSREAAIDFRNFSFETGMNFSNFRKYFNQFATMGLGLSQQDLMGDMANIQRNLTQIALGGGNLDTYKLLDIREAARRNDLAGVLEGIRRGVQRNDIDNSMLTELIGRLGVSNPQQWAMAFSRNIPIDKAISRSTISSSQQIGIIEAEEELRRFGTVLENLRDQITSAFAPGLRETSLAFKEATSQFALFIKQGGLKPLTDALDRLLAGFLTWLKSFSAEDIQRFATEMESGIKYFINGLRELASSIWEFVSWIGGKPTTHSGENGKSARLPNIGGALKGAAKGIIEGAATGGFGGALRKGIEEAGKGAYQGFSLSDTTSVDKIKSFNTTTRQAINSYVDQRTLNATYNVSSENLANQAETGVIRAYNQMGNQVEFGHSHGYVLNEPYASGNSVNGGA